MQTFTSHRGDFKLERYPVAKDKQLRAWDAADDYILMQLETLQQENKLKLNAQSRLLILNDAFGALSTALSEYSPTSVSDSFLSQQALTINLALNNIDTDTVAQKNCFEPLSDTYDLVIIKIPKNLAMLEDQLHRIRKYCNEETCIISAAMSKHIHTSTLKLFERIIGTTTTSLARKKARLVFSELDSSISADNSPYPSHYTLGDNEEIYYNHANVFSRDKLDIGSRFLLQHIPTTDNYSHILDLACGNGVLGIAAAKANPHADLCFVDESYMAVESARINAKNILKKSTHCEFKVSDCLQGIDDSSQDLILNNPPFHQNHVVGDFIAWQMFTEARQKLKTGGEFIIVGNRHLGYHIKLKKLFGKCEMIASNKKFVILKAIKS